MAVVGGEGHAVRRSHGARGRGDVGGRYLRARSGVGRKGWLLLRRSWSRQRGPGSDFATLEMNPSRLARTEVVRKMRKGADQAGDRRGYSRGCRGLEVARDAVGAAVAAEVAGL